MRFLFLTNFYPPIDFGGWEQWCQEVADAFIARGHQVEILTSRYQRERVTTSEPHVRRLLHLETDMYHYRPQDFLLLPLHDRENRQHLERAIADMQPDAVVVWGMWLLNSELAAWAEELCPGRVAYYLCGFWPIPQEGRDPHTEYWSQRPQPFRGVALAALKRQRRAGPQLQHVACVSQFVLDRYRRYEMVDSDATVIYGGIDIDKFHRDLNATDGGAATASPLRLLFTGLISPQKGADTAVQAVLKLSARHSPDQIHLTLVGGGHPDFVANLQQFIGDHGLEPYVTFHGKVAKEQMPAILRAYDVLLFTSAWEEPLARVMMEGMAAGLALISTTTGGSGEAVKDNMNGLAFEVGNADDLAHQIERLLTEPELLQRLARAGQQTAITRFNLTRMVDELEQFFATAMPSAAPLR
jgi:glycosyltransferase involved in cell wall biosynthesis